MQSSGATGDQTSHSRSCRHIFDKPYAGWQPDGRRYGCALKSCRCVHDDLTNELGFLGFETGEHRISLNLMHVQLKLISSCIFNRISVLTSFIWANVPPLHPRNRSACEGFRAYAAGPEGALASQEPGPPAHIGF
eukprot:5504624-Pyramimonas_sp.AAC.1